MLQVHNKRELTAQVRQWKQQGKTIALVPTMGNLHQGHLSLIQLARSRADKLLSSIFVNPMQFGPNEDLADYPRTVEQDCRALMEHECDLVYLPTDQDLYPAGLHHMTQVQVPDITRQFEGEFRPGHLTGVSTIVLKLFNLIQPDIAVFGKKDYQQWRMIQKMVKDLNLSIEIIAEETVREADGLALSSRNLYLSKQQRQIAIQLQSQLLQLAAEIRAGNTHFQTQSKKAIRTLTSLGFEVDYFEVCQQRNLQPAKMDEPLVIVAAAKLGDTRLIDNIEI